MDCIARTVELSVLNEISKCFTSDDFKGILDFLSICSLLTNLRIHLNVYNNKVNFFLLTFK